MWLFRILNLVLLCFQLLCVHAVIPTDGTANILLIITDDTGIDVFSGYHSGFDGYSHSASTPYIDNIANNGVRFHNAWSHGMCSPARASIYTGRHAFRHGITYSSTDFLPLDSEETTIAEVISDTYASGYFGKWHLGYGARSLPTNQGWDYFSGSVSNIDDYFSWTKTQSNSSETQVTTETCDRYATLVNTNEALTWIRSRNRLNQVWFAVVAYNAGHSPMHVPPSHLYSHVSLESDVGTVCLSDTTDHMADCYRAMVEAMDTSIGNLLSGLPDSDTDTLVILVGDNGTPGAVVVPQTGYPYAEDHAKLTVYEGGVNVPLLMQWTGTDGRSALDVTSTKVYALDIFATIIEVSGCTIPSGLVIDAQSLLGFVDNTQEVLPSGHLQLFTELNNGLAINRWALKETAEDGNEYKYITNEGTDECYDLTNDEAELFNLWDTTSHCTSLKTSTPNADVLLLISQDSSASNTTASKDIPRSLYTKKLQKVQKNTLEPSKL